MQVTKEQAKEMLSRKIEAIERQLTINQSCIQPLEQAHQKLSLLLDSGAAVSMSNIALVVGAMAKAIMGLCNNNIVQLQAVSMNMREELEQAREQVEQLEKMVVPANLVHP